MLSGLNRNLCALTLAVIAVTIGFYAYFGNLAHGYALGTYRLLGQAFLTGHTYLNVRPFSVQTIDSSLYQGKFYLYFGPFPALVWMALNAVGLDLGDQQLTFVFCALGSVSLVWLLAEIVQKFQLPAWVLPLTAFSVCFGSWLPLLLRHTSPMPYDVCISSAYCFTVWGICALWYASEATGSETSAWWKIGASACFGIAIACRAIFLFDAIALFSIWLMGIRGRSFRHTIYEGLLLAGPWFFCIALHAVYNYCRFGSALETGFHYQVSLWPHRYMFYHEHRVEWDLKMIPNNSFAYFLQPMPLDKLLPWKREFGIVTVLHRGRPFAYAYGLWLCSPFALWSLWLLAHLRACRGWLGRNYDWTIGVVLIALALTFILLGYDWITNRYMADFAPWILLCAALGFMDALYRSQGTMRKAVIVLGFITAVVSVYIGAANSFCGFSACRASYEDWRP